MTFDSSFDTHPCALVFAVALAWLTASSAYAQDQPDPYGPDPFSPTAHDMPNGYDCVVMPHAIVDVSSAVEGRIEAIYAERGDRVAKGQLVAQLEDGVEEANEVLARYRAAIETEIGLHNVGLKYNNIAQDRADKLYRQEMLSPADMDAADRETELAVWRLRDARERKRLAELEHRRAEEVLKLKAVRSPITGVVVERYKWTGEYVEEDPIVRVAQLNPLRVEVVVPIELHGAIYHAAVVEVIPETEPDRVREAIVKVIDPMGDPASGTFRVQLELPNPDNELLGGIKCRARFTLMQATIDHATTPSVADVGNLPSTGSPPVSMRPPAVVTARPAAGEPSIVFVPSVGLQMSTGRGSVERVEFETASLKGIPFLMTGTTTAGEPSLTIGSARSSTPELPEIAEPVTMLAVRMPELESAETPTVLMRPQRLELEPVPLHSRPASEAFYFVETVLMQNPAVPEATRDGELPSVVTAPVEVSMIAAAVPLAAQPIGLEVVVDVNDEPALVSELFIAAEPELCRSVGPLDDEKAARNLAERLSSELLLSATVRQTQEVVANGFIVLASPSDQDVHTLESRLRSAGVKDLLVMQQGIFDGQISLGTYNGVALAKQRAAALRDHGFDTRVTQRTRSVPSWWIDLAALDHDIGMPGVLDTLTRLEPEHDIRTTHCPESASEYVANVTAW